MKPFAQSCEENRQPILDVLRVEFAECRRVLEIGSGTGQHAVYFARALSHLTWQTSDLQESHPGIRAWLDDEGPGNAHPPLLLDVSQRENWPEQDFDGVFSANTAHIMGWPEVEAMFSGIGQVLLPGGRFCLYGPFNYGGRYTSESNARFDQWLKDRDPRSGIRDISDLDALASKAGLKQVRDYEMPVNNRILVWQAS